MNRELGFNDHNPITCFECEAEFAVTTPHVLEEWQTIAFCPFCGSEVDVTDNTNEEFEEDDE